MSAILIKIMLHCFCFVRYLECPSGSYKSAITNTKCLQCPVNSASNAERTACTCDSGFYKLSDLADCKGNKEYLLTALSFLVKI